MNTNYTFDQHYIQDDVTGEFLHQIETAARCRAFTGEGIRENKIMISADKTVRVWDSVAAHYTTVHSLSPATVRRIIRENVL